jgi:predicted membrane metal-binding protein
MNRPLVSVVLAYAAGLLLAEHFQPAPSALLAVSGLVLFVAVVINKYRTHLIWPLLALIGWSNFSVRTAVIAPHDLRTQIGAEPALVTLRGELLETPRQLVYERDGEKVWRSLASVRVSEIRRLKEITLSPAHGDILTTTPGVLGTNIFAGQAVEISGVLSSPPKPVAEGLFDYQSYLAGRGIFYQLDIETTNDWKIISAPTERTPWGDRFLNWAQATLAYGLPAQDEALELLWAMTLGWRPALTPEVSAPFMVFSYYSLSMAVGRSQC